MLHWNLRYIQNECHQYFYSSTTAVNTKTKKTTSPVLGTPAHRFLRFLTGWLLEQGGQTHALSPLFFLLLKIIFNDSGWMFELAAEGIWDRIIEKEWSYSVLEYKVLKIDIGSQKRMLRKVMDIELSWHSKALSCYHQNVWLLAWCSFYEILCQQM